MPHETSEHVSEHYKLRDAILLAASWQPATPWGRVNQASYAASAEAARQKMAEDATIEYFSMVGATVTENLTVHPDDAAIARFSAAMSAKMKFAREVKGRGGWDDEEICTIDGLTTMFLAGVSKGDMVDVANFAMMIWMRAQPTT